MSTIAEFNPLKLVGIRSQSLKYPNGLIVVVGPNSCGKTLFLRDIENTLLGREDKLVVCSQIEVAKPKDINQLLDDLLKERLVRESDSENIQVISPHIGSEQRTDFKFKKGNLRNAFDHFREPGVSRSMYANIGRTMVTSLFLVNRLTLYKNVDRLANPADAALFELQALYVNQQAQERLAEETGRVFGNAAWLDTIMGNQLRLKTSGRPEAPSHEDRFHPMRAEGYKLIEQEGDGYKSYVGICVALLLGRKPVCLIDEPEMCLHPAQETAIGQFIGRYGSSRHHATIVATHSSYVLRGMLQTSDKITVIRLTKDGINFRDHMVDDELLRKAIQKPSTRAEAILDGLFTQGVVIVESEGDRVVYQTAGEDVDQDFGRDIHFASVHGTGGVADVCRFYKKLKIPAAIIVDAEGAAHKGHLKPYLETLADPLEATGILRLCDRVSEEIRKIPPVLTEENVQEEIDAIKGLAVSWKNGDDEKVRSKLKNLAERVSRIHRLKDGGIEIYKDIPAIYDPLQEIVRRCAAVGLYIVPVGELEGWCKHLDIKTSKQKKLERADEMASKIRACQEKTGDVWDFVRDVIAFLRAEAKRG